MHAALLLGFGASALNPYMAFAVLDRLVKDKDIQLDYTTAEKNYIKDVYKRQVPTLHSTYYCLRHNHDFVK